MAESRSFTVDPRRPYSLERTVARLVRFDDLLERYDPETGVYSRLIAVGRRLLCIRVRQQGTPSRARLQVTLTGRGARDTEARTGAETYVKQALGAGQPISGFYRAFRDDPLLGPAVRRERGLRIAGNGSVFEALITTILCQQINLKFAYSIRRELTQAFGRKLRFDKELFWNFPTPQRLAGVSEPELRGMRISAAKTRAILGAASAFKSGALDEAALASCSDEAVIERLTALPGIGPWTAEQVLMRGLGRSDVFPASDLGVIKYLAQGLLGRRKIATEQEMREFAEGWRPYRSLALIYAYAELGHRRQR